MKDKKISKKRISISVISLLMALLMVCLAGCNKDGKDSSSASSSNGIIITPDDSSDTSSDDNTPKLQIPTRTDEVKSAKEANDDVVGWLYIPGLTDVDRGVCHDASSAVTSPAKSSAESAPARNTGFTAHTMLTFATPLATMKAPCPPTP